MTTANGYTGYQTTCRFPRLHRPNLQMSVPLREVQYETCSFALDVLACPRCGGRLRLIAVLEASDATARILRHLHLPTEVPLPAPARPPPGVDDWAA